MKPWQLTPVYLWQRAPFLRITIPLAAGIGLYDSGGIHQRAHGLLTVLCITAAAGLIALLFLRRPTQAAAITQQAALVLFFGAAGWLFSRHADDRTDPAWYGHHLQKGSGSLVRILEEPVTREKTFKARVQLLSTIGPKRSAPVKGQALVYFYKDSLTAAPFHAGDTLLLPAAWQPISGSGNPFEFDYPAFARRANLYHQQFLAPADAMPAGRHTARDETLLQRGHAWSVAQLRRALGQGPAFGLMQAMLMGDERDFDPALRQTYSETGVIHIVSISGSHTALLFGIVAWAFSWIRKARLHWIKYAAGVALVWIYVLMAGAPPSAMRSAIMFSVFAFSAMTGRNHQPFNTLLAAAAILLIIHPMWLFAIGFQLSFLAVLSLTLFYRPLYKAMQQAFPMPSRGGKALYAACAASIAAEILTAPLVMYHFHNFPVHFLPANLLAGFLLGVVCMIGGLLILALSFWPAAAMVLGKGIGLVVAFFNSALEVLNSRSPAWSRHISLDSGQLATLYAAIGLLGLAWLARRRQALIAALGMLCIFLALLIRSDYTARQQTRLVAYNSGRQTAIEEIRGKGHRLLMRDSSGSETRAMRDGHIGYRAWQERGAPLTGSSMVSLAGKKVLLLAEQRPAAPGALKPDVLIAAYPVRPADLRALRDAFPADTLVLAGPQKRWAQGPLADTAAAYGIPLHIVAQKGAFILE